MRSRLASAIIAATLGVGTPVAAAAPAASLSVAAPTAFIVRDARLIPRSAGNFIVLYTVHFDPSELNGRFRSSVELYESDEGQGESGGLTFIARGVTRTFTATKADMRFTTVLSATTTRLNTEQGPEEIYAAIKLMDGAGRNDLDATTTPIRQMNP
ncbi:hypothetical protein [Streptomyces sp. HC307]|uniref:hypothetical protein n=1 Tax=Streptomyces flavusporus TaxID=3385496 RepID=UPI003917268C